MTQIYIDCLQRQVTGHNHTTDRIANSGSLLICMSGATNRLGLFESKDLSLYVVERRETIAVCTLVIECRQALCACATAPAAHAPPHGPLPLRPLQLTRSKGALTIKLLWPAMVYRVPGSRYRYRVQLLIRMRSAN